MSYGTLIPNLTTATVQGSDLLPVFSSNNYDSRKISIDALAEYINGLNPAATQVDQFATPVSGNTVTVSNFGRNTRLILTPGATLSNLTIVLDQFPVDQETISVTSTQEITTLTVNTAVVADTIVGPPTTINAAAPFRLQYCAVLRIWFRI